MESGKAAPGRRPVDALSRFRRAVADHPDRCAVRGSDGALTFAELDRRTARLARALTARGVAAGDRVGIALGRSTRLVVALLAVWRAGAAYVPLDPHYPYARLEFMAQDAGIRALVAEEPSPLRVPGVPCIDLADPGGAGPGAWAGAWAGAGEGEGEGEGEGPQDGNGVDAQDGPEVDAEDGHGFAGSAAAGDVTVSPPSPAYVIYTSGSTGRPKGVEATRGGVAALLTALEEFGAYPSAPRVVAWNASVSFDASVQQWARVCRGDTVVVLTDEDRQDPARLGAVLDEHGVTDLDLTPSHWEVLRGPLTAPRADGRTLRLFMGGEPVPARTWREIVGTPGLEALNLYGPTECTVDATAAWFAGDTPRLGGALPGSRPYVLDEALRPVPDGVAGELYLAGPRLAHGYVGRPGLTADRFVADPFGRPGERMYRTGDLVERTSDGNLTFLGRADRQMKFRGFRVEPGEIESVLCTHPDVTGAVVLVRDDGPAGEQLVAYCVPARGPAAAPSAERLAPSAERLRDHVAATLPEFMVPSRYVPLDALPLTPNGKLDTAALPKPPDTAEAPEGTGAEPDGPYEQLIAEVWSEVLGQRRISADDDFFALGGHSLMALRVVARLKRRLGVVISVKEVYRHPRLRDLARRVESHNTAPAQPR
ncbi:non-ribosomal peptide synthetase [Streptomyces sp. NPDC048506]|uniref:non-ribosomal peptide synthetase n=1 Tax=Streptomyces sp. NPDC048506 TaxID=3155028 RepID=UPI00343C8A5E